MTKSKLIIHGPTGIAGAGVLLEHETTNEQVNRREFIPAPPVLLTQEDSIKREERLRANKQPHSRSFAPPAPPCVMSIPVERD